MSGVTGSLGKHVQDTFADSIEPPVSKQPLRPPGQRCVRRRDGENRVCALDLLPIRIEHVAGRDVATDDPGTLVPCSQPVDDVLVSTLSISAVDWVMMSRLPAYLLAGWLAHFGSSTLF